MSIIDLSVSELSYKLRSGELGALEVVRFYLNRVEKFDSKVRAFITLFPEKALRDAGEADRRIRENDRVGPLTGVPVVLKDNLCLRGYPTTCASKILQNFVSPYNAAVVERLEEAGAVILGKTNMDEFAMGSSTENSRFFPTRNPWDLDRVPGGSSGGSAAAVAAAMAPLGLGSDTGGSIRQPAAFCGVTGMKPTYGRVSRYGLVAFASSLDQIGPIGRSVEDISILLDVISGRDERDSTSADMMKPSFYNSLKNLNLKGLKAGMPIEFFGEGLDEDIRKTLEEARAVLEKEGVEFVDVSLPSLEYGLAAYYIIAPSEASSNLARFDGCRYGYRAPDTENIIEMYSKTRREGFGDEVLRRIMTGTFALSAGYYDAYYLKAQKVRTLIREDFDRAFEKCDFLFTPATPSTAFKIGEKSGDPLEMYLSDIYTVSVNLAGLPGLVVPCGFSGGLPSAMQLIGRAFDEETLLKVGAAWQKLTDYNKQLPNL